MRIASLAELTLEALEKIKVTNHMGIWFETKRSDEICGSWPEHRLYFIPCPFCEKSLLGSGWWLPNHVAYIAEDELKAQVASLGGKTFCESCRITFSWDFMKNTVEMCKEVN
jgi:hypothetical protein